MKDLSVIIPVFNEAGNLPVLNSEIAKSLDRLNIDYEVIYVDDGSTDNSFEVLSELKSDRVKIIEFRKNFGQTPAMQAGIDNSSGRVIVMLDADMQNDPQDIPRLLEIYNNGYDLVSGWRKKRQDNVIRTIPSKIANKIISCFTGCKIHDTGCTLKAYNGEILRSIRLFGEQHRFIPAIFAEYSDKITEIPVNHKPRMYGKSKYNLSRVTRVVLDLLAISYWKKYKDRPIYFWGSCSFVCFVLGILLLLSTIIYSTLLVLVLVAVVGALFLFSSVLFIAIGIVLENALRIGLAQKSCSIYSIEKIL